MVAADLGATLTAKASWTDNGGFANTLSSAATDAVAAASTLPTLSIGNASATEGSLISFPLTLSAAPGEIVSVQCSASFETGDTAAAADLASDNSTATIQIGSTSGSCAISSAQDTIDEENETFTVTLSGVSSNAQLGTVVTAKGTINDDDDPPTVDVGEVSGAEGTALTFTVTLSDESGKTVTVDYATSVETGDTATSGTDFTAKTSTTLTFEPGDPGDTTKTFTVQTTDDTDIEGDETFTVTLSNPSNATLSTTDATAKGTIENDDWPPLAWSTTLTVGNHFTTTHLYGYIWAATGSLTDQDFEFGSNSYEVAVVAVNTDETVLFYSRQERTSDRRLRDAGDRRARVPVRGQKV